MDTYVLSFVIALMLFIGNSAQEVCDGCDCTIRYVFDHTSHNYNQRKTLFYLKIKMK